MSKLLDPAASLASYFDELLAMDETELAEPLVPVAPQKSIPNTEKPSDKSAIGKTLTKTPDAKSLAEFAEPDLEQKEKLQKLLQSSPPKLAVDVQTKDQIKVEVKTKTFVADPNEIQEWPVETLAPPAVEIATPAVAHVETPEEVQISLDAKAAEWLENGRPAWAQSRFDVLLFQVSGLTLAVPLASLGQIQKITDELTPLFGQADWFMGLLPTPGGKIRTVNTALFVMPERYDENFPKNAKLVVSINGVPWGLAVDSVNQPISIDPDQVKWRVDRTKRPWLAGTVKEHMCALLDIPTIGLLLQSADKNAHKSFG